MEILPQRILLFSTFSLIPPTQTFFLGKAEKKQFLQMVYFVFLMKTHEGIFLYISKYLITNSVTFLKEIFFDVIASEIVVYDFIITDHAFMIH